MDITYIDKLAWIYLKNRKILSTLSKGKDTWYIPGGKREEGGSDEQAVIREIKEELSVDLIPETLELYGVFEGPAHGKPEGALVRMTCYTADFTGEVVPDNEIESADWLDYSDRDRIGPTTQIIFDDLKQKGFLK